MQFLLIANLRPRALEGGAADISQMIEEEKAHARKAYMEGSIRQMWLQTRSQGAIAILEADSLEHARTLAAGFPLAQASLLETQVIELIPYEGFGEK